MVLIIVGVLALFCFGLFVGLLLGRRGGRLEVERELPVRLSAEREDAVKRSRAVLGGQVAEQLAPYLPEFPCSFEDARFLGKPLDYVCFSGASTGEVDEIVFVEVKTGESSLSKVEKSARQAIIDGRVRWVEYRIPLD
ncbi:MAG: Holliday junction resolvase-like protein [Spirochaetia bacterium]|nr:Holliday junction resolvase-like protein [Spirochaetia bacterium]